MPRTPARRRCFGHKHRPKRHISISCTPPAGCVAHRAGRRSRCLSLALTRRRCSRLRPLRPRAAALTHAGRWLRSPRHSGRRAIAGASRRPPRHAGYHRGQCRWGIHSRPSEVLAADQAVMAASCFRRRATDQEELL
jgi:hypothetical protein